MENVRLIDAIALETKAYLTRPATWDDPNGGSYVVKVEDIENAPTIDPESLRPTGRKERSAISGTGLMCTNCYSDVDLDAVFCKYCGAKMEV